jgi:hypothetical protein
MVCGLSFGASAICIVHHIAEVTPARSELQVTAFRSSRCNSIGAMPCGLTSTHIRCRAVERGVCGAIVPFGTLSTAGRLAESKANRHARLLVPISMLCRSCMSNTRRLAQQGVVPLVICAWFYRLQVLHVAHSA